MTIVVPRQENTNGDTFLGTYTVKKFSWKIYIHFPLSCIATAVCLYHNNYYSIICQVTFSGIVNKCPRVKQMALSQCPLHGGMVGRW